MLVASSSYMFIVPFIEGDGGTGRSILIVQLYVLCPFILGGGCTGRAFQSSSFTFFVPFSKAAAARVGHFDRQVICSLPLYHRRRRHRSDILIVQLYYVLCPFVLGDGGTGRVGLIPGCCLDVTVPSAPATLSSPPPTGETTRRPHPPSEVCRMRSSLVVRTNAPVATVLGSIPASVDTVESEGRQMKQC